MTATTINRTPFRKVFDIPAHLLISDRLKWESTQGTVALTTNGTRFAHVNDGKLGYWWTTKEAEFRPLGMTWEAAEALVASPPSQPAPQAKVEEPFRPGLPPAEMRAVCKEWEWCDPMFGCVRPARFQGDEHILTDDNAGPYRQQSYDHFRPLGRTWADVEAEAAAAAKATKAPQLPKDGDIITVASAVAVVKEGCRQALDEAATRRQPGKVGNFSHVSYITPCPLVLWVDHVQPGAVHHMRLPAAVRLVPTRELQTGQRGINPWPPRTFIIASPPGRRKYVKLLLKRLGYRNVDKIPTTDKQTPFDLGRSLPDHERENLLAIAPGIVLRDVL